MYELEPQWEYVADRVMGGVSDGQAQRAEIGGTSAMRLTGTVSLENDGGFIQMAFDVDGGEWTSGYTGIFLEVIGNDAEYEVRLRTSALSRPWQSFRASFTATPDWQEIRLPFSDFAPNKTDAAFDPAELRRIGVLAYGREMQADVAVARVGFYK